MTQEEKQLLLKDLCVRLPYGVKTSNGHGILELSPRTDVIYIVDNGHIPYLRPMSSMTDEETAQVQMFMDIVTDENYGDGYSPSAWDAMNGFVQYCDSHHLDHRGLIPMGLALSAPDGMYKTQNK